MHSPTLSPDTTASRPPLRPIPAPLAWMGSHYARQRDWPLRLESAELAELEAACREVGRRGLAFADITARDFPLPTLGPRLARLRRELRDGSGFALIKGVPVDDYSEIDLRRIFLGIASHLGTSVSQSFRGDYLGDVMDYREPGNERPYRRGGLLEMHRDPCDIVGLFCFRQARHGGLSRVASAAQVFNIFLAERPDLLEPLLDGFRLYITRDDRSGDSPVTPRIPVFTLDPDGLLHCTYIAELAASGVEKGGESWAPRAREALEVFEAIANRDDVHLDMAIERGDMQFLNNRTTVHGRTDYEDWPEAHRRRLMFRVWLMCPEWPQPATSVNRLLFGKTDRADGGVGRRA
ncbi:MAG: TauD/TfdA family dioxygenase [Pigmentiphaga sp.]|nr:TauD/TfdA family dioxygenase [Pigmentiphaga sp.]